MEVVKLVNRRLTTVCVRVFASSAHSPETQARRQHGVLTPLNTAVYAASVARSFVPIGRGRTPPSRREPQLCHIRPERVAVSLSLLGWEGAHFVTAQSLR